MGQNREQERGSPEEEKDLAAERVRLRIVQTARGYRLQGKESTAGSTGDRRRERNEDFSLLMSSGDTLVWRDSRICNL